jgi:serine/threonine protein phosphatase PrpC
VKIQPGNATMTAISLITSELYLEQEHDQPQMHLFCNGCVAIFSRRSPSKDARNEDAAALIAPGNGSGVIAVADGCGGMAAGETAARLAVQSLRHSVAAASTEPGSLRGAILDGIERANRSVCDLGTGAATTLTVVQLEGASVQAYHVGDSQVLLVGNRGRIKLQTRSHSPVGYAVQAGMLSEEDAIYHKDRHLVSNVLGSLDAHIDIGPKKTLAPCDTLVVASDGLFDNLHTAEVVEIIRKGPLEKAARQLVTDALTRMDASDAEHPGKPDDLTFVIFRLAR